MSMLNFDCKGDEVNMVDWKREIQEHDSAWEMLRQNHERLIEFAKNYVGEDAPTPKFLQAATSLMAYEWVWGMMSLLSVASHYYHDREMTEEEEDHFLEQLRSGVNIVATTVSKELLQRK